MLHIKYTRNFIIEQRTQTMETNTTQLEYISIYDRPKRGPRGNKYTDEEKAERARISTRNCYYRNIEKEIGRKRLIHHRKKEEAQTNTV